MRTETQFVLLCVRVRARAHIVNVCWGWCVVSGIPSELAVLCLSQWHHELQFMGTGNLS